MGQLAAIQIFFWIQENGWNLFGDYSYDSEKDGPVACTANCAPFADTTGYFPRNHPKRVDSATKYNVTGDDRLWQPLLVDDGTGFFTRQQHAVQP